MRHVPCAMAPTSTSASQIRELHGHRQGNLPRGTEVRLPTRRSRDNGVSMGQRLSKIYTRTGDRGETGLGDGSRIGKASLRVEAMVNSFVGLLLTRDVPEGPRAALCAIQHDLFDLGGELSIPGARVIEAAQVQGFEAVLDDINAALPPLRSSFCPGETNRRPCATSRARSAAAPNAGSWRWRRRRPSTRRSWSTCLRPLVRDGAGVGARARWLRGVLGQGAQGTVSLVSGSWAGRGHRDRRPP